MAALWRRPWAVISPTPSALQAARSRKLNARLENGAPEYPENTNCHPAKTILLGAKILLPLKPSWIAFHSRSAALKAPVTGTSWKTLPIPLNAQRHNFVVPNLPPPSRPETPSKSARRRIDC